jgi:hypothetical protein
LGTSEIKEVIFGYGHKNIQATHKTTLEFTKDAYLSKKGDCIIAVAVDKTLADLSAGFKKKMRQPHSELTILIEASGAVEKVNSYGSPQLILAHPTDMVIRKSDYICNRTLAICADKAAKDLSRDLVKKLKNPKQRAKITLIAVTREF